MDRQLGVQHQRCHSKVVTSNRSLQYLPAHCVKQFISCLPTARRQRHPTPVLWTKRLPFHFSLSCIGEGNGNPLQCSCLENPRDRGAWWAAIYGVVQSQTRLKRLSSSRWTSCRCSVAESCLTLFDPMDCSTPGSSVLYHLQSLLRFRSIESVMLSNHLILCHLLLLVPSIFPSIRIFSNESAFLIRWPKYWSFRVSTSPSNGFSGLISFRNDWFDFLAVQGTLRIFSNTTVQKHQFFGAQPLWFNSHMHV